MSYVDEVQYPLRFKIFIPWVFSIIETILPRFVNGLLFRKPLIQVTSAHPITSNEAVRAASMLLNTGQTGWMVNSSTWYDLLMMMKEALLTGTSMAKVPFIQREKLVTMREPVYVDGRRISFREEKKKILDINRPMLRHADIYDVFPDTLHSKLEEVDFVVHLIIKGLDEIKNGGIEYENLEELEDAGDWNIEDTWAATRLLAAEADVLTQLTVVNKPRMLLEFTVREHTKDGEKIRLVTVGNERVFMRDEVIQGPFPWVKLNNNPMPHEFWGLSEIQALERLQFGINDHTNIQLENALMTLTKMWITSDEAEVNLDQLIVQPNGTIQVAGNVNEAIKTIDWGSLGSDSARLGQDLVTALQFTSGIHDMLRGATAPRKEVATTVIALQQAAEARIDYKLKFAERTWLAPLAATHIGVAQENLEEPAYMRTGESEFQAIDMFDIQGLFDYDVSGAAIGIKELQRVQITEFIGHLGSFLGPVLQPTQRIALMKALAKTYTGLEDVERVLDEIQSAVPGPGGVTSGGPAGPGGSPPNGRIPGLERLAEMLGSAQAGLSEAANQVG